MIGRTDTVVGTEVDTLLATEIAVPVPLMTPAMLAASEGVEVTVGKTVAVGVGVLCVGATAMGRTLALGPDLLIGVGVVVGFIVAVGGTRDIGGADVTMILVGVSCVALVSAPVTSPGVGLDMELDALTEDLIFICCFCIIV